MTAAPEAARPRVLFVSHTRVTLPLPPHEAQKWALLSERAELRILVARGGGADDAPFHRVRTRGAGRLSGAVFFGALPFQVRRQQRRFAPDAIICQSPFEAAMVLLGRPQAPVICEVHGDWGTATTAYGSPLRRWLSRPAGAVARAALRRAAAIRTVSPATTGLVAQEVGRAPTREFPAWIAADAFTGPPVPLPARPGAVWVGTLQPAKDPETLAQAWPAVIAQVPEAQLVIVGRGPLQPVVDALCAAHPTSVRHVPWLDAADLRHAYDESWALVLPSRSEGYGRVAVEALLRARPVVGTRVGGIPALVTDREAGLLVPPGDPDALAQALRAVLGDRATAERLSAGAARRGRELGVTSAGYADAVADLVAAAIAGR